MYSAMYTVKDGLGAWIFTFPTGIADSFYYSDYYCFILVYIPQSVRGLAIGGLGGEIQCGTVALPPRGLALCFYVC